MTKKLIFLFSLAFCAVFALPVFAQTGVVFPTIHIYNHSSEEPLLLNGETNLSSSATSYPNNSCLAGTFLYFRAYKNKPNTFVMSAPANTPCFDRQNPENIPTLWIHKFVITAVTTLTGKEFKVDQDSCKISETQNTRHPVYNLNLILTDDHVSCTISHG